MVGQGVSIENRLREIRLHIGTVLFKYIKTKENPADLATRGVSVRDLNDKKDWWHGPKWLCKPQEEWPEWIISDVTKTDEPKEQPTVPFHEMSTLSACREGPEGPGNYLSERMSGRYSSLRKLLRVTAMCRKFLRKRIKPQGDGSLTQKSVPNKMPILTARDLMVEREFWDYMAQKDIFSEVTYAIRRRKFNSTANSLGLVIDEDGKFPILWCQGRYGNTDLPEFTRFPKLLPKGH